MHNWKWTQIAKHKTLTEGPVWDGSGLLYNEVAKSTTFRWDPKTDDISIWRKSTGETNVMTFDRQGQLFACEGGAHRVTKIDPETPDINPMIVSEGLEGETLNWPNDLAIDQHGRVYFRTQTTQAIPTTSMKNQSTWQSTHLEVIGIPSELPSIPISQMGFFFQ